MRLSAIDLWKSYGGAAALRGVSAVVDTGQVTAVIGPNGAGKSTLMRLLAGETRPDSGQIEIDGRRVDFRDPTEALRGRIALIPQELSVVPNLSVRENVLLGRESRYGWFVDRRKGTQRVEQILSVLGVSMETDSRAGGLPAASRRFVMIARVLNAGARFVIFDEPTAGLGATESRLVLDLIKRLTDQDIGVVFVSHKFDEVSEICDTCLVIRDGVAEAEIPKQAATISALARRISQDEAVGGSVARGERARSAVRQGPYGLPLLKVLGALADRAPALDIAMDGGEVVGVYGLLASGAETLLRLLAGAVVPPSMEIFLRGKLVSKKWTPSKARRLGIGYVPGDRAEGVLPNLPVRTNATLSALPAFMRWGITAKRERESVRPLLANLGLAERLDSPVLTLSGGNRQKTVLARALHADCEVLLLDDPCVGVDIGARGEIHRLCRELANRGKVIVYRATAPEELLDVADRILVLRHDTLTADREASSVSASDLHLLSIGAYSVPGTSGGAP